MCREIRHEKQSTASNRLGVAGDGPGLLVSLDQLARDVADDLGLRCVDDIENLAIVAYSAVRAAAAGPWTSQVRRELQRQIVIWAFEEGEEGGSLPFSPPQAGSRLPNSQEMQ